MIEFNSQLEMEGIRLLILFVVFLSVGPVRADVSVPATPSVSTETTGSPAVDHIQNAVLFRQVGTLVQIDLSAHRLTVKDPSGQTGEFVLTQRTRVSKDDQRIAPADLQVGVRVLIRYVEGPEAGVRFARKILVMD
jgi:hypothetical protein